MAGYVNKLTPDDTAFVTKLQLFKYLSRHFFVAQYEPIVNNVVDKRWWSYVVIPNRP